jgi:hypothetical protein
MPESVGFLGQMFNFKASCKVLLTFLDVSKEERVDSLKHAGRDMGKTGISWS